MISHLSELKLISGNDKRTIAYECLCVCVHEKDATRIIHAKSVCDCQLEERLCHAKPERIDKLTIDVREEVA